MSYVYMKALESAPERYDKGINMLAWGKMDEIRQRITGHVVSGCNGIVDPKVFEIGAGTGTQALAVVKHGINVTGIDVNAKMLEVALSKAQKEVFLESGGAKNVGSLNPSHEKQPLLSSGASSSTARNLQLYRRSAAEVLSDTKLFPSQSYDVVMSTLCFSEMYKSERAHALEGAYRLLKPGGTLVLADEVIPSNLLVRGSRAVLTAPVKAYTFLVTQTTTRGIRHLETEIGQSGFEVTGVDKYQMGGMKIVVAKKTTHADSAGEGGVRFLSWKPKASYLYNMLMRMAPNPTPDIGLIRVNDPVFPLGADGKDNATFPPVFVTCNFKLTVKRLHDALRRWKQPCYILVCPSNGINVWCAACGGEFTERSVVTAAKLSGLEELLSDRPRAQRRLILPQLAAPAVDAAEIARKLGGVKCVWGPVRLEQIPQFMETQYAAAAKPYRYSSAGAVSPSADQNPAERRRFRFATFPFADRFEMSMSITWFVFALAAATMAVISALGYLPWFWLLPYACAASAPLLLVFILWPLLPGKTSGNAKMAACSLLILVVLSLLSRVYPPHGAAYTLLGQEIVFPVITAWYGSPYLRFIWMQAVVVVVMLCAMADVDGMSPGARSAFGAHRWNAGKTTVFAGTDMAIAPYGKITLDSAKCIGCGDCVRVCPREILDMTEVWEGGRVRVKSSITHASGCVNCNACVNRCPRRALTLEPETKKARRTLERHKAASEAQKDVHILQV